MYPDGENRLNKDRSISPKDHHYPSAANTVQITVQIYSDIVQLFVQQKTCLPCRSERARETDKSIG